ncbi:hypothetical protein IHC88_21395 (plasmid) [Photobacterium damselae subsp. damselae]|nr:hypothetical protein IHC88_21395 [Photobacterium damselae subsp. damselae]
MPPSEVRSIAKSIAKWTMAHFTLQRFSKSQAKKRGGGVARNQKGR